ncbi:MAG: hypothetical protein CM1200mP41_16860 [Gammaproteobacteria bacterium]|nr:MAG: hypothetical protein CM1200mP41_16860 [Gammaproteobacteria bacterium]
MQAFISTHTTPAQVLGPKPATAGGGGNFKLSDVCGAETVTTPMPSLRKFCLLLIVSHRKLFFSPGFLMHTKPTLSGDQSQHNYYGWMTKRLLEMADKHAGGRLISVLKAAMILMR